MYRKEIVYDRETHDYAMYLDGELVGFARTYDEAERTLDELIAELSRPVRPQPIPYTVNNIATRLVPALLAWKEAA